MFFSTFGTRKLSLTLPVLMACFGHNGGYLHNCWLNIACKPILPQWRLGSAEALRWCERGARLGSASLQHRLAMHLLVGKNCAKDKVTLGLSTSCQLVESIF